ncbi:MAG: Enoyl-CoA hydratase/isomerase [Sphingomonas bacterium]|uniref:enoyl-CoA hydratase n=1 Tax=Sphingomonas bacterium TaxID=1895847 RepID=UPI002629ECE9|nr:enoyl-CoA hydratase [Sphingomonas bacterium]MDB5694611.1 Enoyl-CoA hydratase/isomerase [Sphingomonas bacterium]
MSYSDIMFDVANGVATITLDRPERLNAWTPTMAAEIRDALERSAADDGVRAIVLTGAGRGFCAGADMTALTDISAQGKSERAPFTPFDPAARADFHHAMTYLPSVPKPIIAAVNGAAAGLGLAMLLFCDLRFSSDRAVYVSSFSRRGLIAEHGTSWMLTRLVGHSRALDLMLSSRRVDAAEAHRIGLVDRVFPADTLLAETMAYAREIADLVSPRSTRVIKRQLWDALFEDLGSSMAEADRQMAASLQTDDFREGVAHFIEKRAPRFKGH